MKVTRNIVFSSFFCLNPAVYAGAESCPIRSIFLNGVDISGATNQELKNIDMHLDERGDIYLHAPHYRVYEEDHYLPLGAPQKIEDALTHSARMALPSQAPALSPTAPVSSAAPASVAPPVAGAAPPAAGGEELAPMAAEAEALGTRQGS